MGEESEAKNATVDVLLTAEGLIDAIDSLAYKYEAAGVGFIMICMSAELDGQGGIDVYHQNARVLDCFEGKEKVAVYKGMRNKMAHNLAEVFPV